MKRATLGMASAHATIRHTTCSIGSHLAWARISELWLPWGCGDPCSTVRRPHECTMPNGRCSSARSSAPTKLARKRRATGPVACCMLFHVARCSMLLVVHVACCCMLHTASRSNCKTETSALHMCTHVRMRTAYRGTVRNASCNTQRCSEHI